MKEKKTTKKQASYSSKEVRLGELFRYNSNNIVPANWPFIIHITVII